MPHVDYDNTNTGYIQDGAASKTESGPDGKKLLNSHHDSAPPGSQRRPEYNQHNLLIRLGKFLVVGGTGVLVNSLTLFVLFQWVHLPLVVASVLSTELAIANNFCWNDRWTFRRKQFSLRRFAQFNLISLGGLVIGTGFLWILVRQLGLYYLTANVLSIALTTAWNFLANSLWTWVEVQ